MDKDLLHKYFRGDTTPPEEIQIMDWAEASPENHRQYLEERKLWNALLIHYSPVKENNFFAATKSNSFNGWKIVSIAATVALLISLAWMQLGLNKEPQGMQAVLVPAGQRVQLVLEDGTKVWLNSKSSFTYPTSFGSQTREVQLDGEGFFEVARNEKKPFIVKTKKYDIKVLGTTFNVYAYNNEKSLFETSLLSGSVDVAAVDNYNKKIILKPQEKVVDINGVLQKDTIDNPDRFRWKDGLICLDDEPFESLMRKFSAYYDIKIVIENQQTIDYRCTGKFRQSDGVEYALKVIRKDLNFDYQRDDESNTITIK